MSRNRFPQKFVHIPSIEKIEAEVSSKLSHAIQLNFGISVRENLILRFSEKAKLSEEFASATKTEAKLIKKQLLDIQTNVPSKYLLKDACKLFLHILLYQ